MSSDNRPRVLLFDIETSLQPAAVFALQNNDFINPENLLEERYVISVAWKWLGDKKVEAVSVLDDPKRFRKDPHDDAYVVKEFHEVLQEADVIVGHNSDSFDLRYLRTRMLYHGLPVLPPIATIDTYKVAKANFLLNSNSLNYIGQFLKVGKKIDTPKGLWLDALKGERKAIKTMVEYNIGDVVLLEKVYLKLRPYVPNHVNREIFGAVGCPRCGSKSVQSRGVHRALTRTYQRWQCNSCAGWFRSLKADSTAATVHRVI